MRRSSTHIQTKRLAVCAVLAAMGTVILGLGVLIEVMDLSCAALAGLVILPVLLTYGVKYALLTYAVTAVLGLILMPQSLSAWLYAGLVGFYPVLKPFIDRLPRIAAVACKILLVSAVLALYLLVFYFVMLGGNGSFADAFLSGFGDSDGSPLLAWALVGLSLFTFFIYDFLINRLLILYRLKWKKRLDKWMK